MKIHHSRGGRGRSWRMRSLTSLPSVQPDTAQEAQSFSPLRVRRRGFLYTFHRKPRINNRCLKFFVVTRLSHINDWIVRENKSEDYKKANVCLFLLFLSLFFSEKSRFTSHRKTTQRLCSLPARFSSR